jgi:hypothetical protein
VRTLVIGRSPSADVVIADASLAPHHAELVITDDGRLYLTDCATDAGTWIQSVARAQRMAAGPQGFVPRPAAAAGRSPVHRRRPAALSRGAPADASAGGGAGTARRSAKCEAVARDPATGETCAEGPERCCTYRDPRCRPGWGWHLAGLQPAADPLACPSAPLIILLIDLLRKLGGDPARPTRSTYPLTAEPDLARVRSEVGDLIVRARRQGGARRAAPGLA